MKHLALYLAPGIILGIIFVVFRITSASRANLKTELPSPEHKEFAVARDDLLQPVTIPEIEIREHVADPLSAVPNLPFGHLNAAWRKFTANQKPQDEIWAFSSQWATPWGRNQNRSGYVILRGDTIGPHFLSIWKTLGER